MTGVDLIHVPYRGGTQALADLIGGQVQVYFGLPSSCVEYVRASKLRALAVTTAFRSDALPNVPTMIEFVPGYEAITWYGVGAPKNMPAEIIAKLNREINADSYQYKDEGVAGRHRQHRTCGLTRQFWQAHRRRHREVGQGDQVRGHQGGLICGGRLG
jgi:hypothetical protein